MLVGSYEAPALGGRGHSSRTSSTASLIRAPGTSPRYRCYEHPVAGVAIAWAHIASTVHGLPSAGRGSSEGLSGCESGHHLSFMGLAVRPDKYADMAAASPGADESSSTGPKYGIDERGSPRAWGGACPRVGTCLRQTVKARRKATFRRLSGKTRSAPRVAVARQELGRLGCVRAKARGDCRWQSDGRRPKRHGPASRASAPSLRILVLTWRFARRRSQVVGRPAEGRRLGALRHP